MFVLDDLLALLLGLGRRGPDYAGTLSGIGSRRPSVSSVHTGVCGRWPPWWGWSIRTLIGVGGSPGSSASSTVVPVPRWWW
jgi:hypothetical protein